MNSNILIVLALIFSPVYGILSIIFIMPAVGLFFAYIFHFAASILLMIVGISYGRQINILAWYCYENMSFIRERWKVIYVVLAIDFLVLYFIKRSADPLEEVFLFLILVFPSLWVILYFILKSKIINDFVDSWITKLLASFVMVCIVWNARVEVVSVLTEVFRVDASNFPLALSAGVFFKSIGFVSIFFGLFLVCFQIAAFLSIFHVNKCLKFTGFELFFEVLKSISPLVLFCIIYFFYASMLYVGGSNRTNLFIVDFAYKYDFMTESFCDLPDSKFLRDAGKIKIAYIGSNQDKGLYVLPPKKLDVPIKQLSERDVKKYYPSLGGIVSCNQPSVKLNISY